MKPLLLLLFASILASNCAAETIQVGAAISLKDAFTRIAAQYQTDTGETIELTFASSGQLASQITNGAPIDLFISAANLQVDQLVQAKFADETTKRVVATNTLVLAVPPHAKVCPHSLKALPDAAVTRIAIGEPRSVPAGRYAAQALEHAGIAASVKDKLIFAANVRQALAYVEHGEVSAALIYATDAKLAGDKVQIAAVIDSAAHDPIVYPAVIVHASPKRSAAARFLDYILSKRGQACLKAFGFAPPPHPTTRPTP
jgi:molybdate transport system substrate-binding protein